MEFNPLTAISPLDGRYAGKVDALRAHFSEFGLIRARLKVEIEWLKALAAEPHFNEIPPFSAATIAALDAITEKYDNYGKDVKIVGLNDASHAMRARMGGKLGAGH